MNLKEAKIMLEKINRLYESMILDSKIDPFEQELMLSYIKKLYLTFSFDGEALNLLSQKPKVAAPPPPAPKPKPKAPPRVVKETPKAYTPPKASPAAEPVKEVVRAEPAPAPPREKKVAVSEEVALLFEDKEGKELSDKLASLPIKDLTKAMGINERILTVNELFGKDQQAFVSAMSTMNGMTSFDEAKKYLVECAEKYNWTSRNKKKKAQVFIKLVRRRFR